MNSSILSVRNFAALALLAFCSVVQAEVFEHHTLTSDGRDPVKAIYQDIEENDVMVYCTSKDKFCKKTRQLFRLFQHEHPELKFTLKILDVDLLPEDDGDLYLSTLERITGQDVVPNIYVTGDHVGGNHDIHVFRDRGRLLKKLQAVALPPPAMMGSDEL